MLCRCLGPTQHLKQKYGSGYLLEVKLAGSSTASHQQLEARVAALETRLTALFPSATCLESFAERAQYKIPQSDVSVLSAVFANLEESEFCCFFLVFCFVFCFFMHVMGFFAFFFSKPLSLFTATKTNTTGSLCSESKCVFLIFYLIVVMCCF